MKSTRAILLASAAAGAIAIGGVLFGVNAFANSPAGSVFVAASPSPSPGACKSNEDATHEKSETAAREAAENTGQCPPGRGPGPGKSNEDPTHEKSETPAHEAAENS